MSSVSLLTELLRRTYAESSYPASQPIPSVEELSREFDIGRVTVIRALKLAVEKGYLVQHQRSRRYYRREFQHRNQAGSDVIPPRPQFRYIEVSREIRHKLENEVLDRHGGLPSVKEMSTLFACNRQTVSRALRLLEEKGVLHRSGNKWRAGAHTSTRSGAQVYVTGTPEQLHPLPHVYPGLIDSVERSVHLKNWGSLRFLQVADPMSTPPEPAGSVAGFVHIFQGYEPSWEHFLASHPEIPTVILDLSEFYPVGTNPRYNKTVVRPDNRHAGRRMGQYLTETGHAEIAFFSHAATKVDWLALRLEGIMEYYSPDNASSAGRMHLYHTDILTRYVSNPATTIVPDIRIATKSVFDILPEEFARESLYQTGVLHVLQKAYEELEPLFEEAFSRRGRISAWVFANDHLALTAYRFLEKRNALDEVAICGFDNLPVTYKLGITSYDFDYIGLGRSAANALFSPPRREYPNQTALKIVPGYLIAR